MVGFHKISPYSHPITYSFVDRYHTTDEMATISVARNHKVIAGEQSLLYPHTLMSGKQQVATII